MGHDAVIVKLQHRNGKTLLILLLKHGQHHCVHGGLSGYIRSEHVNIYIYIYMCMKFERFPKVHERIVRETNIATNAVRRTVIIIL